MGVKFNSNGKLLLSGEYLVLKGAKSLSIPTRFSQTLEVSNNASGKIKWESYDQNKKIWFDINFDLNQEWNLKSFKEKVAKILIHGFLHLLGFDHKKNKDYSKMLKEENLLFKSVQSKIN